MIPILLLSISVVGLAMLAMAVGVIFSRPCLRGSCGGLGAGDGDDNTPACEACPLRARARTDRAD